MFLAGKALALYEKLTSSSRISCRVDWTEMNNDASGGASARPAIKSKSKSRSHYDSDDDDDVDASLSHALVPFSKLKLIEEQRVVYTCAVGFIQILPTDVQSRDVLYHPLDATRVHPDDYERAVDVCDWNYAIMRVLVFCVVLCCVVLCCVCVCVCMTCMCV